MCRSSGHTLRTSVHNRAPHRHPVCGTSVGRHLRTFMETCRFSLGFDLPRYLDTPSLQIPTYQPSAHTHRPSRKVHNGDTCLQSEEPRPSPRLPPQQPLDHGHPFCQPGPLVTHSLLVQQPQRMARPQLSLHDTAHSALDCRPPTEMGPDKSLRMCVPLSNVEGHLRAFDKISIVPVRANFEPLVDAPAAARANTAPQIRDDSAAADALNAANSSLEATKLHSLASSAAEHCVRHTYHLTAALLPYLHIHLSR